MSEITFEEVGDETHYSCGCKQKVVGGTFFFTPCSEGCEVYKYTLEQSQKQGNLITKKFKLRDER